MIRKTKYELVQDSDNTGTLYTVQVVKDTGEAFDLNAEGEPVRTLEELQDFITTLEEQKIIDGGVRCELIEKISLL